MFFFIKLIKFHVEISCSGTYLQSVKNADDARQQMRNIERSRTNNLKCYTNY